MFVKICGTTNLPDAELAVELGADALGFIFAPSKRQVSIEEVAAITEELPDHVELVGVFAEPDAGEIARAVQEAGLTGVQMHFAYEAAFVGELRALLGRETKLWQVVGLPAGGRSGDAAEGEAEQAFVRGVEAVLLDERISVVLLDAVQEGASGGLGVAFDWERARGLVEVARSAASAARVRPEERLPEIVVAGGLSAENVARAVTTLEPWGVDVVSGVEISPGRKGPQRMAAFFAAAREGLGGPGRSRGGGR